MHDDLKTRLERFGQQHLLEFEAALAPEQRRRLRDQIAGLDLERLADLHRAVNQPGHSYDPGATEVIAVHEHPLPASDEQTARALGLAALQDGRVAAVLVAGGQGSRLGFHQPKGMFPIGAVRGTSLYQIFAEQIHYWRCRTGRSIPWYIMTSPATHADTERYFAKAHWFGLPADDIICFMQGTMPALDRSGKVVLADRGNIFLGPDGHGGMLLALQRQQLLEDMARRGVNILSYFQVDNPLVKCLDPIFIGKHLQAQAEYSLKVVRKQHAKERIGLVVRYAGQPRVIEYSDLPPQIGDQVDAAGQLRHWAGSIAIHLFDRLFLERVLDRLDDFPVHVAHKVVPTIDAAGNPVIPTTANAVKFERFIFDILPLAQRTCLLETTRESEFFPIKNATGTDSPHEVRAMMIRQAGAWLTSAGIPFPRTASGTPAVPLEVSPLLGFDAEEFTQRVRDRSPVTEPTYFGPGGRQ